MTDFNKKDFQKAAEELNDLMGLKPAINTKKGTKTIKKAIVKASKHIQPDDDISDGTQAVVDFLTKDGDESDGSKAGKESVKEDSDNEDLVTKVKKTKKLVDLQAIARTHLVFSKLQDKLTEYEGIPGTNKLKADMLKALGGKGKSAGEVKEPKPKKEKPSKSKPKKEREKKKSTPDSKSMTRQGSVIQSVKELCKDGATLNEIAKRSDEIYAENGGKKLENLTNISNIINHTINALKMFEVLSENDGIYTLK